jgi:surface protein
MELNEIMKNTADAIREKTGKSDLIAPVDFANEIKSISAGSAKPKWTGHADAEGLRAIGWTDEDIAYYQENGVNWNEEDDEWHKVTDDNKALYGVLTANNISEYSNRIVYLPKIDTSGKTDMYYMFKNCRSLKAIPMLDTSSVTNMKQMFHYCESLTTIPRLDTSNVMNMYQMFNYCYTLTAIPQLDTSRVTDMNGMFSGCYSLTAIPQLDTRKVKTMAFMFSHCRTLTAIPKLDTSSVTDMSYMFDSCNCLTHANLENVKAGCDLSSATLLTKDSLLYLINNEAATKAITIKLASYAYDKWATDPDIVEALANHPNISISK